MKGIVVYSRAQAREQSKLSYGLSDRRWSRGPRGYGDKNVSKSAHRRAFWKRARKEAASIVAEYIGCEDNNFFASDAEAEVARQERDAIFSIFREPPLVMGIEEMFELMADDYDGTDRFFRVVITSAFVESVW